MTDNLEVGRRAAKGSEAQIPVLAERVPGPALHIGWVPAEAMVNPSGALLTGHLVVLIGRMRKDMRARKQSHKRVKDSDNRA